MRRAMPSRLKIQFVDVLLKILIGVFFFVCLVVVCYFRIPFSYFSFFAIGNVIRNLCSCRRRCSGMRRDTMAPAEASYRNTPMLNSKELLLAR